MSDYWHEPDKIPEEFISWLHRKISNNPMIGGIGGGTVKTITSTDGSIDVVYPNGPITDLSADAILSLVSAGGTVLITNPTGPTTNLEINFASSADNGYCAVGDKKSSGTDGGTFTSGAWQTRTVNTEIVDDSNLVTISGNRITLQPGTYRTTITAPAYAVDGHQIRLQDVTHGTTLFIGTVERAAASDDSVTRSQLVGQFTVATLVYLEIQHKCATTNAGDGFGKAASFGDEWYTIATFWATNITYANSTTYDANGNFTVPTGVTTVDVEVWGGGGHGGNNQAGGGGGAYARKFSIPVTPGGIYAVTVGAPGAAGTDVAAGTSSFTGDAGNTVSAVGGRSTNDGAGGPGRGGIGASGVGDIKYSGGDGGANTGAGGAGAGGGSGGSLGAGGTGGNGVGGARSTPGVAGITNGGAGGAGGGFFFPFTDLDGLPGAAPGGGGGAKESFGTTDAAGAAGRVIVGWNDPPP